MVCVAGAAFGGDIDRKDLLITGLSLEVDTTTVVADAGIAAAVQTKFGGKTNDDAPPDNGMTAVGELSGPGIDAPIHLTTRPGHLFQLPVLYEKGDYSLRNIRLVSADGNVLQTAVPSFANITVTQVLDTKLSIRQLTPDDLRARGITVDANNFDVFEHLEGFRDGASYLIPEHSYNTRVRDRSLIGDPLGQFVTTRQAMDKLLADAAGDLTYVKRRIGVPAKYWNEPLYRVDIANPLLHNARMPSGFERGANEFFRWGGSTNGGLPEIVTGQVPKGGYRAYYSGLRP